MLRHDQAGQSGSAFRPMFARVEGIAQVKWLEARALGKLDGIGRGAGGVLSVSQRRLLQSKGRGRWSQDGSL